jgi:hypothetical protein
MVVFVVVHVFAPETRKRLRNSAPLNGVCVCACVYVYVCVHCVNCVRVPVCYVHLYVRV